MSDRYRSRFQLLQEKKRKAFMPFTILGWPNRARSLQLIKQMIESGASALELGFAFSDPVADGPVIQEASFETLATGFTVEDGFELLEEVRALAKEIPIGVLVYYNLVLKKGLTHFFKAAKKADIDGVLIADLPVDFNEEVAPLAKDFGISPIYIISPVSPEARVRLIAKQASGFIYLLSRLGVTGVNAGAASDDDKLSALVSLVKEETQIPICAGFGVSDAKTAQRMFAAGVQGVITGSKVITLAREAECDKKLSEFYNEMLGACLLGPETILSQN